jgi:serine/threonine protein kinase
MISEEIEALSRARSNHIVKHLRYLRTTNNMYEVYDHFDHGDLNTLLSLGKLTLVEGLFIFHNLVSGLKVLFMNRILHRDIKPENIFLKTFNPVQVDPNLQKSNYNRLLSTIRYQAVLGDFGLCRILDENEEDIEGAYGSPMYMSPECLQGFKYGLSSDLYSLGIVLYEIIFN